MIKLSEEKKNGEYRSGLLLLLVQLAAPAVQFTGRIDCLTGPDRQVLLDTRAINDSTTWFSPIEL